MQNLISKFDMFSPSVQFELQSQPKTSTKLGFYASCFIYLCTFLAFLFLSIEYINLAYPQQIDWKKTSINPKVQSQSVIMLKQNLLGATFIGLGITTKSGQFFKNDNATKKAFNMEANNCNRNPIGVECIPYQVSRCSEAELHPFLESVLGPQLLEQIFCVNFREQMERNITLQGQFYSPEYQYFIIKITRCSAEEDTECMQDDEIDELLEDATLGYLTLNFDYNVRNFNKPGKLTAKTFSTSLSADTYNKFDVFYSQAQLTTYFNILSLFDLSQSAHVLDLKETKSVILPNIRKKHKIIEIRLQLNDQIDIYQRFYQSRVLEIISSALGLFFILYAIIYNLLLRYQRITYQLMIGKSLEESKYNYKLQKSSLENKIDSPNSNKVSPIANHDEANLNLVVDNDNVKKQDVSYDEKKMIFDFDASNYIVARTKLNDDKVKGKLNQVQKKLDIVSLLNQSEDFELLKSLLLDENQLQLFEFIKNESRVITPTLQECYFLVASKLDNQVNRRLMEMIEPELKEKLEASKQNKEFQETKAELGQFEEG